MHFSSPAPPPPLPPPANPAAALLVRREVVEHGALPVASWLPRLDSSAAVLTVLRALLARAAPPDGQGRREL